MPRRCGLATYTADLREALGVAAEDVEAVIVAIDRDGLDYGDEVLATVDQDTLGDYSAVGATLRAAKVDVVLIQHEYGIFGGPDGSNVLELARAVTAAGIPYLVTLHTVLSTPSPGQAATLRALCAEAALVTVFTETARRMALATGLAAGHRLAVVPHGAPVALLQPPERYLPQPQVADLLARLDGRPALTTFGLLSDGKGIDIAIEALAMVVTTHPETQYVIAGATHPEVRRTEGERYRDSLVDQVRRLGLERNVHFVDAFLGLDDLSAILHASTLFVTPYRSPEQICSGALTFALAAGLPVVASRYRYAEDMLASGAGRLVPIGDAAAVAAAVTGLLSSPEDLDRARAAAEAIGSWLPWPTVAAREAELIREVVTRAGARHAPQPLLVAPPLVLDHLDRLTDEIAILQFAEHDEPSPASGYCVDDVARLAIVAAGLLAAGYGPETRAGSLAYRWLRQSLRFLSAAAVDSPGTMHNQLSYQGTWEDWPCTGDHVGRAVWGLGVVAGTSAVPAALRERAARQLTQLASGVDALGDSSLRTVAYALLGLARAGMATPAARLVRLLDDALRTTTAEDPGWRWFEPVLTYDNARLPQALLAGAALVGNRAAAARALDALDWYAAHLRRPDGVLRCVGNVWHRRGENPARWSGDDGDEQPLDAAAFAEAFAEAWRYRAAPADARLATTGLAWFLGGNRTGLRLLVESTGACHDGLSPAGVNANRGAESTLAYHQALLALVRSGLATMADPAVPTTVAGGPVPSHGSARTLAARASAARQAVPDRPAPQRAPNTGGPGAAPPAAPPANRSTAGHWTRSAEDHTDAR